MSAPAVMIIGLDGATFDLLDPWIAAGELPNIAALLRGGARGPLRSTHPPLTPVAWSSFLTGCNPGRHGIFGFMRLRPDYRPVFLNGGSLTIPTFLDLLSEAGMRVGALNVPWTWPPPPVNGFCLSGLDAPAVRPDIAHPPGLLEEVQAAIGGYFGWSIPPRRRGYALDRLDQQVDLCADAAVYLLGAHPVDVFAVVFGSSDHVQHWFWRDRSVRARDGRLVDDLLLYTYRRLDVQIGRLVERCAGDSTTVILMSDHGAGPCEGGINLDLWLASHGWLTPARHRRGIGRRLRRGVMRAGAALLPEALRRRLGGRLSRARRGVVADIITRHLDWPSSQAFAWSDYGNVSLNLCGRFGAGCVAEDRREGLLAEIAGALAELTHPLTGERLMSAPLRVETTWHGDQTADAPDLLAVVRGYRHEILSCFAPVGAVPDDPGRAIFTPPVRQGTHRLHGVFCATGPRIRSGIRADGLCIEDIAPTVLHLVGQPVPGWMDGRVATQILERSDLARRPPARDDRPLVAGAERGQYDEDQQARVARNLRGLGYL